MKLIAKKQTQIFYRSALIATMAAFAVGCGSSSTDDTVGVIDESEVEEPVTYIDVDRYSLDEIWANNSLVSVNSNANSSYTVGIQRILYCLGYHPDSDTTMDDFVDGVFGPKTKAAVEDFQRAPAIGAVIGVDGIVGEETWGRLQDIVEIDQPVATVTDYESRSIQTANNKCGTEAQFFQNTQSPYDWKMAKTPGSTVMVQFSINAAYED